MTQRNAAQQETSTLVVLGGDQESKMGTQRPLRQKGWRPLEEGPGPSFDTAVLLISGLGPWASLGGREAVLGEGAWQRPSAWLGWEPKHCLELVFSICPAHWEPGSK